VVTFWLISINEGGFTTKANVAKLGPNLILFKFKVGTNGLLCLLDSLTMHSFVNPSVEARFGWVATKVVKAHQGLIGTKSHKIGKRGGVGGHFEMRQNKFVENFTIYALDGIEAILGNTFLYTYHVNVSREGSKLRIIARLVDKSISLKAIYMLV
jgi:hypothetical protein